MTPAPIPERLRVALLGAFRLSVGDAPVTGLGTQRLQGLLAYLVLHRGEPQSRQQLAFLFWPDTSDAQARTNLRNLLHRLREALPNADAYLDTDTQNMWWRNDTPLVLDVAEFEQAITDARRAEQAGDEAAAIHALEHAATLYQGDLLPDCYDDWIVPERERLREAMTKSLERLVNGLEHRRAYDRAIAHARQLLGLDPLHENAYLTLMRLLAASGDRAGALRAYHTCLTAFQQELSTEPGQAIRDVYARLLAMDVSDVNEATAPSLPAQAPLVGREGEWKQMLAAWEMAMAGRPRLLNVSGEAGIGKTRLAEELLTWARRQGVDVAIAHCFASADDLAYAPVITWLRDENLRSHRSRLDETWLVEISRLLPEVQSEYLDLPSPAPLTERWQRQRLFEALARATLAGERRLLLLIDDLQWCDRDTLEWLHYLLRFDPRARLLIVGAVRTEEVDEGHPLITLLDDLRHGDQMTEIALCPLSQDETSTLARHLVNQDLSAGQLAHLFSETEGNPLFVVEAVRAGLPTEDTEHTVGEIPIGSEQQVLPPKVQAVVARRLARVSPAAREILGTAAVIGRSFTFDVLARAAEGDEDSLVRGLDELWQRRIVREQGADAYDFSHDKLRAVVYAGLSTTRRRVMHRRAAEALAALHSTDLDPVGGQIALHYERARLTPQAIAFYRRAAEAARKLYANADAIDTFKHTLALLRAESIDMSTEQRRAAMVEVATELGDLLHWLGHYDEARVTYQQVLEGTSEAIARSHLHRKIGNCWRELHRYDEALTAYLAAETALDDPSLVSNPARWQAWVDVELERINVHYWLGQLHDTQQAVKRLQPIITQHGTPQQRGRFHSTLAMAVLRSERYIASDEAVMHARAYLAALNESSEVGWQQSAHFQLGFALLWHGDWDEAEYEMLQALDLAERRGDVSLQGRCLTYLTVVHRWRNEPDAVREYAERGLRLAASHTMYDYAGAAHGNLAWLAWRAGQFSEVQEHGQHAMQAWARMPNTYMFQWIARWPLIGLALTQQDAQATIDHARCLLDPQQQRPSAVLETALEQAVHASDAGDTFSALAHLATALEPARELGYL